MERQNNLREQKKEEREEYDNREDMIIVNMESVHTMTEKEKLE